MTYSDILKAHGFTQTQAADAIGKSPVYRSKDEKALITALVQSTRRAQ